MCLIKVRPEEIEEEPVVPARIVGDRRDHRHHRPSSRSDTTVIETIQPPPPPASILPDPDSPETQIVPSVARAPAPMIESAGGIRHGDHWDRVSPRASVVSTHSRDYYVDSASYARRSPRGSFRHMEPRSSVGRIEGPRSSSHTGWRELDHGENGIRSDYGHGKHHRPSGTVSYVNPRHSTASHRSGRATREKIVVVNRYGDKSYH